MKALLASLAISLAATTYSSADPNPQLVNSVQSRLAHFGYSVDVSAFATNTVARLHLTLSSRDSYLEKRRAIRAILRNPTYK